MRWFGIYKVVFVAAMSFMLMAAGISVSDVKPIVSLPLDRSERGGLHVQVLSTEGVPLRVVFDTAAANSILFDHEGTLNVVRKLGRDQHVYFPFTDRLSGFRLIDQFTIEMGGHSFTSNSWVSGPWKPTGLFPGREEPNYDVIAGRDVFNTFAIGVDPRKRKLSLYENGQDLRSIYGEPISLTETNTQMAINMLVTRTDTGVTESKLMIIDTGFPGVLLFASDAELTAIGADELTAPSETLNTAIIVPSMLSVGELTPITQNALIVSKGGFAADGIIGTSFLNNYMYAFDIADKKLYLAEK